MRLSLLALILIPFGVLGMASAHAYLETSNPTTGTTLQAAPEQITLNFSEPLELRFSTFSVVPLETNATDPREIKLAAMDLMEVIGTDEAGLEVEVLTTKRASREVTLGLPDLSSGTYVVMWRLLSTDTHTSDDFITFTVASDSSTTNASDSGTSDGN